MVTINPYKLLEYMYKNPHLVQPRTFDDWKELMSHSLSKDKTVEVVRCKDCKYSKLVDINEKKAYECYFDGTPHPALFYCAYGDKDYIEEDEYDSEIVKAEYHYEEGLGK